MTRTRSKERLVETGNLHEAFVDDIAAVTPLGPVSHLLFTARQQSPSEGYVERVAQVRLIVPTEKLQAIGRAILSAKLEAHEATDMMGEPLPLH
jgi:hypothetical protein